MAVHDITAPLRPDLPTWPDEPGLQRTVTSDVADGDDATVSVLRMGSHSGTHIDAPVHFLPDGGGIETLPVDALVGPVHVVDLTGVEQWITAGDLDGAGLPPRVERLLAKTSNSGWSRSDTEFREGYVGFAESAARWCLERGVRLLGNDYLSIEPFEAAEDDQPVHHILLEAGVVILEGVELEGMEAGEYELAALPLQIPGCDGAPTRAVLVRP
jgi:arylformamidase